MFFHVISSEQHLQCIHPEKFQRKHFIENPGLVFSNDLGDYLYLKMPNTNFSTSKFSSLMLNQWMAILLTLYKPICNN